MSDVEIAIVPKDQRLFGQLTPDALLIRGSGGRGCGMWFGQESEGWWGFSKKQMIEARDALNAALDGE